ncbi:hypothetical protein CXG81DRAFT_20629 [Caulochytrium protostelioides]|uniref:Pre-mRNA-processing protein 45 n=1 Tax=Caulochytrium protostelioides TaxID=1555241 RepID=A0A4P9X0A4_9FUNG|nr:hypothetical protein CXG81DRAFT_20629 [Caulochytrium protostelioides]|eukprot:RKO99264.1 hypothetical protein CXG81DRAFT_20629 [Caulochytrium protostelioides]
MSLSTALPKPRKGSNSAAASRWAQLSDDDDDAAAASSSHALTRKSSSAIAAPSLQGYGALVPADASEARPLRPSAAAVAETTARTRAALEKFTQEATARARPLHAQRASGHTGTDASAFVRYTPADGAGVDRVVRLVAAPLDPMAPSRTKLKAPVRATATEAPAPVLHAPARKISKEAMAAWRIPPSISRWKNPKGYTIALDKRLAADGRGDSDAPAVSNHFAELSDALQAADRQARQEVRARAELAARLAKKEQQDREDRLRELAQKAREQRAGIVSAAPTSASPPPPTTAAAAASSTAKAAVANYASSSDASDDSRKATTAPRGRMTTRAAGPSSRSSSPSSDASRSRSRSRSPSPSGSDSSGFSDAGSDASAAAAALARREAIRRERERERRRQYRLQQMGRAARPPPAGGAPDDDDDRDITEKVALGIARPAPLTGEALFDARLFNRSQGLDSGFHGGDDEGDTAYDAPLALGRGSTAGSIYAPVRRGAAGEAARGAVVDDASLDRLVGRGLGAERGDKTTGSGDGPVQFQKETEADRKRRADQRDDDSHNDSSASRPRHR